MICFHWRWMHCFYARLLGRLQQSCCTQKDVVRKANKHRWALLSIGSLLPSDLHPEESHKAAADWERVNKTASVSEDTYSVSLSYIHMHKPFMLPGTQSHQRLKLYFIHNGLYLHNPYDAADTNQFGYSKNLCMYVYSFSLFLEDDSQNMTGMLS